MSTSDPLLDRLAKMLHEKYCSSLVMGDEIPWDDKIGKGRWYRDAQAILADLRAAIAANDPVVCEGLGMRRETDYGTTYPQVPVTDVQYTSYRTPWIQEDHPNG